MAGWMENEETALAVTGVCLITKCFQIDDV